ncbi:hypothetical protein DFH28DRAFT_956959 [Melampsora americana]|nr:hypothetical protein DFH28DRAFT_956959 [Melampsora americana]
MRMKSLRIVAPFLILCGLVDWSHSRPASTFELQGDLGKSLARNVKGDDNLSGVIFFTTDINSKGDLSSKLLESVNLERKQKGAKTGNTFKSLAGDDVRVRQSNIANQSKTLAQGAHKTFLQKIQSFLLEGPVKVWKRIKQWLSKPNFFISKEKEFKKLEKDPSTRFPNVCKLEKSVVSNFASETQKESSAYVKQISKQTTQDESKDPAPLKEEAIQMDMLGSQHFPVSDQLVKVKGTSDSSPVKVSKPQKPEDITIANPSNIEDLNANSELLVPHRTGEDLTNAQQAYKASTENPHEQYGFPCFDPSPKENSPGNMHLEEEKSSVGIQEFKEKLSQKEPEEKIPHKDKQGEQINPEPDSWNSSPYQLEQPHMLSSITALGLKVSKEETETFLKDSKRLWKEKKNNYTFYLGKVHEALSKERRLNLLDLSSCPSQSEKIQVRVPFKKSSPEFSNREVKFLIYAQNFLQEVLDKDFGTPNIIDQLEEEIKNLSDINGKCSKEEFDSLKEEFELLTEEVKIKFSEFKSDMDRVLYY